MTTGPELPSSKPSEQGEPDDEYVNERRESMYRKIGTPSDGQLRCLRLAGRWLGGLHHLPKTIKTCGDGISLIFHRGMSLATFDFSELTCLVFLAHDMCIRAEVGVRGTQLGVSLHPREGREGSSWSRHPSMEASFAGWRNKYPVAGAR